MLPQRIFQAHRATVTRALLLRSFTVAVGTIAIDAIDDGYDENCAKASRNDLAVSRAHAGGACARAYARARHAGQGTRGAAA